MPVAIVVKNNDFGTGGRGGSIPGPIIPATIVNDSSPLRRFFGAGLLRHQDAEMSTPLVTR